MLPWSFGVAVIVAIFVLIYFLKSRNEKDPEIKDEENMIDVASQDPKASDVILARLSSPTDEAPDYAILWNGVPNKSYDYSITETTSGALMATGTIKCPASGVVKIRGISLVEDSIYDIKVNDTSLQVRFAPPEFYFPALSNPPHIDFNTSSTPTDLEVIYGAEKVARGHLSIKMDPPGFICDLPSANFVADVTIMIYNGANAVNILTIPKPEDLAVPGETRLF